MIRSLQNKDIETVCSIVNDSWRTIYFDYVNPQLLDNEGCKERTNQLKEDFLSKRLAEYVWEEKGNVLALLSIGNTADKDQAGAFEIWRIYIVSSARRQGIGSKLLSFAELQAQNLGYSKIVIWAFKNNKNAISFYEKHGYHIEKEDYLGTPYCAYGVRLLKNLN